MSAANRQTERTQAALQQTGGTSQGGPTHVVASQATPGGINRRQIDAVAMHSESGVTKMHVLLRGFHCVYQHWAYCAGVSAFALVGSLFLLLLLSTAGSADGGSDEGSRDGGWRFVFVVMVAGFVASGVTCCASALTFLWASQRDTAPARQRGYP